MVKRKTKKKRDTIASLRAEFLVVRDDTFRCMAEIKRLQERSLFLEKYIDSVFDDVSNVKSCVSRVNAATSVLLAEKNALKEFTKDGKDLAWYKENTDKLLQWKQDLEKKENADKPQYRVDELTELVNVDIYPPSKPVYQYLQQAYSSEQQGLPPRGSRAGRRKSGRKA